ncbi:MAG: hypothetical protein ACOYMN_18375, partial [Roseimicrobium sp.]
MVERRARHRKPNSREIQGYPLNVEHPSLDVEHRPRDIERGPHNVEHRPRGITWVTPWTAPMPGDEPLLLPRTGPWLPPEAFTYGASTPSA